MVLTPVKCCALTIALAAPNRCRRRRRRTDPSSNGCTWRRPGGDPGFIGSSERPHHHPSAAAAIIPPALFSAKALMPTVDIWTDVPGSITTDPRVGRRRNASTSSPLKGSGNGHLWHKCCIRRPLLPAVRSDIPVCRLQKPKWRWCKPPNPPAVPALALRRWQTLLLQLHSSCCTPATPMFMLWRHSIYDFDHHLRVSVALTMDYHRLDLCGRYPLLWRC